MLAQVCCTAGESEKSRTCPDGTQVSTAHITISTAVVRSFKDSRRIEALLHPAIERDLSIVGQSLEGAPDLLVQKEGL